MKAESKGTFIPIDQLLPDPSEADWNPPEDLLLVDSIANSPIDKSGLVEVDMDQAVGSGSSNNTEDQVSASVANILSNLSVLMERLNVEGAELFKNSKHLEAAQKAEQGRELSNVIEDFKSAQKKWSLLSHEVRSGANAKLSSLLKEPVQSQKCVPQKTIDEELVAPSQSGASVVTQGIVDLRHSLETRIASNPFKPLPVFSEARRRIGGHELNERSYIQIKAWLTQLKSIGHEISIQRFIELQNHAFKDPDERSWIKDGWIVAVDLSQSFSFPSIAMVDLSNASSLTELRCCKSQLTELDLSRLHSLTTLRCYENELTKLDLSPVPNLTELWCSANKIAELDLSKVPGLKGLWCSGNKVRQLDLSNLPHLSELDCDGNQIAELDIRWCPYLTEITCDPHVRVMKRREQIVRHPE